MESAGRLVGDGEAVNNGNGVAVGCSGSGVLVNVAVLLGSGVQVGGSTLIAVGVELGITIRAGNVGGGKGL